MEDTPLTRALVLDENLNPRLATEIQRRGRSAQSVAHLGFAGLEDPELLRRLAEQFRPEAWVLVTADDRMPFDHRQAIEDLGITVATIDPVITEGYPSPDHWRGDVVQRWAHVMQEQKLGSLRRYAIGWQRAWTVARRFRR